MPLLKRQKPTTTADASPADSAGLAAVVGPAAIDHTPRYLRLGDGYAATLIVTGYPAEVGPAWLDPLLAWPGRLDVAVHIDPLTPQIAAARLRKQRARLESNRRTDTEKGRLIDPITEAAADDAAELADRIARGHSKLFRVGRTLGVPMGTLAGQALGWRGSFHRGRRARRYGGAGPVDAQAVITVVIAVIAIPAAWVTSFLTPPTVRASTRPAAMPEPSRIPA